MCSFIVDTKDTYYLDNIYRDIDRLCERYSNILNKEVIGKSVEGRDILALVLKCSSNSNYNNNNNYYNNNNNNNNNNKKPAVLLTGGIHAREDYSVMLCMRMIEYYCYYYNERISFDGFNVYELINHVDMHFIPVANPDGLNIIHRGLKSSSLYESLKSMKIWGEDHTYWKANARGVDLNKNFDDGNWDVRVCVPGTDVPCSDRFKGFSPNSEPETKSLINYCKRYNFSLMATYHCSGDCVFWADDGTHSSFNGIDTKIVDELSKKYIYRKTKVSHDPKVYGCGFENWFRVKMKRPAFCVELSPYVEGGKQNPDRLFDSLVWEHAKGTGLFFGEKAIEVYNYYEGDAKQFAALTE